MLSGFKQFILRGNVVDMAVGVVIGAAFASVVGAFTKDLLTPLITALVGKGDQFSNLTFTVRGSVFAIGDFINAAISFFLVAAAVYFFVVTPINALVTRMRKAQAPADPTTKKCPECLSEIPIDARRCAHCSQPVAGRAA
ncbi:MAG: large conductance mechanosensitive channel protein MscL [Acidobacteria bacterium]|jgi:large conductance mechanosensitive channel|nr:MAG: large conductance mechanosensitive channel protein MscL [Acidobacteriota bacterium]